MGPTGSGKEIEEKMRRFLFLLSVIVLGGILSGCSSLTPLQRSKLITVNHLIDNSRYAEAKEIVEEMTEGEESGQWSRTWYNRGNLCQTAYREGVQKNDRKMSELYPDQLFLAFESYEKAIELDKRDRLERQLVPKYVLLANDFQKLGERHYNSRNYEEALRAFEKSLEIIERPALAVRLDTNLVYNTALAAYEAGKWDKAVKHLGRLHDYGYSANVVHLLSNAYLQKENLQYAEKTLREGIEIYDNSERLILLLADLLVEHGKVEGALEVLDHAIAKDPSNHTLYQTRGLVFQKDGQFNDAILAYFDANIHKPGQVRTLVNLATCYYNLGVEIEESTRTITNSSTVQIEKAKSAAAFESAITWLDQAYEMEPRDQGILLEIYQLYRMLRVSDKMRSIEGLITIP
jgi:tetratricopeptide (TPR) repeat protein